MTQSFFVQGPLPGLNEIIKAAKAHPMAYAKMKQEWGIVCRLAIRQAKLKKLTGYVAIRFSWREPHRRRDIDNIACGKKFCIDALVESKILPNDGWRWVKQIQDEFDVDVKRPGVLVTVAEVVVPIT